MEPKQCVILNPNAGSASRVEFSLDRLGLHTLFLTGEAGDAKSLARRALDEGYTRIIAAGGDGTLNEVINGAFDGLDRVQMGLIPLGTANDFAKSISMPTEIDQAVDVLQAGTTKRLDLVRLTTGNRTAPRYFINASAGGFGTVLDERLDKQSKDWWGAICYSWTALKCLPDLQEYRVQLSIDDEPPAEMGAYNIVVANGRYIGGNIPVAPQASLDDGLFDLLVFRSVPLLRLTTLVPKVLLGQHLEDEDVFYCRASKLSLTCDPSFDLNADGELDGSCPVRFEIVSHAVDFIVGQPVAADDVQVAPIEATR